LLFLSNFLFIERRLKSHLLKSISSIKVMKLSIVTQFYPPDYAATGQLIQELANHLGGLGMQVQVLTGQPGYGLQNITAAPFEKNPPISVRRSRTSRICSQRIRGRAINGFLFCLRCGLRLLKRSYRGDIILLTTEPPYLPFVGYLAKVFFGQPYVCLIYDLYPDVAVNLKVIPAKHWLVRLWDWLNCQIWKQAEGIVVLCPTMKDRITAKCPEVEDKVSVVHSWSDPNRIVPKPKLNNWFARKYGLVEQFTVLYSGNMGRCHDMQTILETALELQNEPIQFVFIGDGAKHQTCVETVTRWGLQNCRFFPFQDKQTLPDSLTACDLSLVTISPDMEGLIAPSKLYGILAAGRPVAVVCEPHSYLCQLVREANCGAAFANGDSSGLAQYIRHLAAHPQQTSHLGQAGRNYLKNNFTPDVIAKQYAEILTAYLKAQDY
jgi:glycosyltransferase involved in cell wall biosynthesis